MDIIKRNYCTDLVFTSLADYRVACSKLVTNEFQYSPRSKKKVLTRVPRFLASSRVAKKNISEPDRWFIRLPKHTVNSIIEMFGTMSVGKIIDLTTHELSSNPVVSVDMLPGTTLRSHQYQAVSRLVTHNCGVIESATGSGKTEMIVALCLSILRSNQSGRILIIGPTILILDTIRERLARYGVINEVIQLPKDKDLDDKRIILSSPQSAIKLDKKDIKVLIFDEAHHATAESYTRVILAMTKAERHYGFTATIPKVESKKDLMLGLLGPIRLSAEASDLRDLGVLAEVDYLPVALTQDYYSSRVTGTLLSTSDWHSIRSMILEDPNRIESISGIVATLMRKYPYSKMLILSDTKTLSLELMKRVASMKGISPRDIRCYFGGKQVVGYSSLVDEFLEEDELDDPRVLIGTSHLDEGADLDNLDILVLVSGGASSRRITQRVGRVSRLSKSLARGLVVDLVDRDQVVLAVQGNRRLREARELGLNIRPSTSIEWLDSSLDQLRLVK